MSNLQEESAQRSRCRRQLILHKRRIEFYRVRKDHGVDFAMRDAMWDRIHIPFTEEDIVRHKETHSHLVDLLDIMGWPAFKRMIATLGGTRIKLPTMAQMAGWHEEYMIYCEINRQGP